VILFVQQLLDVAVDTGRGFLAQNTSLRKAITGERGVVAGTDRRQAEGAHPPPSDHSTGQLRGLYEVLFRSRGHVTERDLFSRAATQHHGESSQKIGSCIVVLVLTGNLLGDAQCSSAGDDGHLADGVGAGRQPGHERVARLVVGNDAPIPLAQQERTFSSQQDLVEGLLKVCAGNRTMIPMNGSERRLVGQVGQVCAAESDGAAGQGRQVHILGQVQMPRVYLKDCLASGAIGQAHRDVPIETTRSQQSRIEYVRSVGRGHDDYLMPLFKAVHLDQQLVERLFALMAHAAHAALSAPTDRVQLVNKDDGRSSPLGLIEQVAHATCPDAHKDLDELGGINVKEGNPGLSRHGASQKRLARAWRPDKENAARDMRAHLVVAAWMSQELDDLDELGLGLLGAGHVAEIDLGHSPGLTSGATASETQYLSLALGGRAPGVQQAPDQQSDGQKIQQNGDRPRGWRRDDIHEDVLLFEEGH